MFKAKADFGCKENTPIFILGMPRSGSTLIEQILSSHEDVYGAGELQFVKECLLENIPSDTPSMNNYLNTQLTHDHANKQDSKYIEKIRDIAPNSKYIIDKMPANY
ncbi:MAG: sulfotransferase [Magnetococcales bacterium]|nr:sulfotransferase [Magnetococcales bacterium]